MISLPALCTGRLYSSGNMPGTNFCWRLSRPQSKSMKISNDTIGNRTRDLSACRALPQPERLWYSVMSCTRFPAGFFTAQVTPAVQLVALHEVDCNVGQCGWRSICHDDIQTRISIELCRRRQYVTDRRTASRSGASRIYVELQSNTELLNTKLYFLYFVDLESRYDFW